LQPRLCKAGDAGDANTSAPRFAWRSDYRNLAGQNECKALLMKLAIYGGTFDPIHHGHLILAREARELFGFKKVIFVPAAASPFKDSPAASGQLRLSMLRVAIEDEPGFELDDCELRRPAPSYTIETIEEIRTRQRDAQIYCLIGEDNVPTLQKWHRFDELRKAVQFVVLDRTGRTPDHSYPVVHRKIDISASEIRKRVASGRSIRYFVPQTVEEMIRREKIYQEQAK
jgi:nicotinate-nucleotide adenylyltransferase